MTISDIAKMAGVSSAAVSRYLNGGPLSEQKREAIREVVHNYIFRMPVFKCFRDCIYQGFIGYHANLHSFWRNIQKHCVNLLPQKFRCHIHNTGNSHRVLCS